MRLILTPSFVETAKSLGYDDLNDLNEDHVLHEQGYNQEILEIEPGEEFEVSKDKDFGEVYSDGEILKYMTKGDGRKFELAQEEAELRLNPGKYKFDIDGESIYLLKKYVIPFYL